MPLMGKSTISTGPWLQSLFDCLPEGKPPFSHCFPMVFHGFPMVFPWFSMVFLWVSHGFPWFSHGFPMVFLWFSYGFPSPSHISCCPLLRSSCFSRSSSSATLSRARSEALHREVSSSSQSSRTVARGKQLAFG